MILALSLRLAERLHRYLHAYAPSNVLVRHLRSPAGRQWALPLSAALAAGYLVATAELTAIVEAGGPGWLNLVVLTCAWNAIKFGAVGVASLWACLAWRLRRLREGPTLL